MPNNNNNNTYQLESGITLRFKSLPAFVVERAISQIPVPEPPIFIAEEDGRELRNPTDPDYLQALQEVEMRKTSVSMMAALIFGAEMIDDDGNVIHAPSQEEDPWEVKLLYLGIDWRKSMRAELSLPEGADMTFARDGSYLLYTQLGPADLQVVAAKTLGGGEAYTEAVDTFQGGAPRRSNRAVRPKRK